MNKLEYLIWVRDGGTFDIAMRENDVFIARRTHTTISALLKDVGRFWVAAPKSARIAIELKSGEVVELR